MKERIWIREVGLRDGLQMVASVLPAEKKLEWCAEAAAAGVPEIEVTSFVPPRIIPQFTDAEEVAEGALVLATNAGFVASALVPNHRGMERALGFNLPKINYVLSASEAHNLSNVRRSTDASIEDFGRIVRTRDAVAKGRVRLCAGIATAFGCTIQGDVQEDRVVAIAARLAELGADEIMLADTVGYGNPGQVGRILSRVVRTVAPLPVAAHFHDTRGLGLSNVVAALGAGVRALDASLGGLGGCPFAPGATGNIATEDTVFLVESLGFDSNIDIAALIDLRRKVEAWLPDEQFAGAIASAGLPKNFKCAAEVA